MPLDHFLRGIDFIYTLHSWSGQLADPVERIRELLAPGAFLGQAALQIICLMIICWEDMQLDLTIDRRTIINHGFNAKGTRLIAIDLQRWQIEDLFQFHIADVVALAVPWLADGT